jgi:hypothetical protein
MSCENISRRAVIGGAATIVPAVALASVLTLVDNTDATVAIFNEVQKLYHSSDLTILKVIWAPHMTVAVSCHRQIAPERLDHFFF